MKSQFRTPPPGDSGLPDRRQSPRGDGSRIAPHIPTDSEGAAAGGRLYNGKTIFFPGVCFSFIGLRTVFHNMYTYDEKYP